MRQRKNLTRKYFVLIGITFYTEPTINIVQYFNVIIFNNICNKTNNYVYVMEINEL